MKIDLHQVDAFTEEKFGGNPAGIVSNADGLSDHEMQQIAREMNLSETAFVLSPTDPKAMLKLRFFTPAAAEIDFCGHATVAALFQLAGLQMFGLGEPGANHVQVETNAGILPMTVTNAEELSPRISFAAPRVHMEPYRLQGTAFTREFGVPADSIESNGTVLVDTVLNYVYIPTRSMEVLNKQSFDFVRIREKSGNENVIVFCFYAKDMGGAKPGLYARGLAPNVGVDEDPFTGSMQAGLVHAAKQNGFIAQDQSTIHTRQGDAIGRPGSATVTHDAETDDIIITANAVQVFSTQMEV